MTSWCRAKKVIPVAGLLYRGLPRAGRSSVLTHAARSSVLTAARQASRTLSTDLLSVESDPKNKDIAVIKMNRKPVNGLNRQLLSDLNVALEKLEETSRGVILTSSVSNIFSAGLDITEFFQKTPEETDQFWSVFQSMWLRLYGSPLITIAAINGHSPAGGCVLAMSCDYRIMAKGKYMIGLNETLVGIVAPFWIRDPFKNTVGNREAEKALQLGKLYSGDEALQVGLVDELCDKDEVLDRAKTEMNKWLKIPDHARILTKHELRKETINKLASEKKEDIDNFTSSVQKASAQKTVGLYLESLKKKSK